MNRSGNIPVLVAIVAVAALGIGGLVALELLQAPIDRGFAGQVMILVGGVLAFLYTVYRGEQASKAIERVDYKVQDAANKLESGVDSQRKPYRNVPPHEYES